MFIEMINNLKEKSRQKKDLIRAISNHVEYADTNLEDVIHVDLVKLVNDFDNITSKDLNEIISKLILIHSHITLCTWRIDALKNDEQI